MNNRRYYLHVVLALLVGALAAIVSRIELPRGVYTELPIQERLATRRAELETHADRAGLQNALGNEARFVLSNDTKLPKNIDVSGMFPSRHSLVSEALERAKQIAPAGSCQGLATAAHDVIREKRIHANPMYEGNYMHSPVRFLATFGAGFCDDSASSLIELARWLGLPARTVWIANSERGAVIHVVSEIFCDNRWGIYDPDNFGILLNEQGQPLAFEELAERASRGEYTWTRGPIVRGGAVWSEIYDEHRRAVDEDPWITLLPGEKRLFFDQLFYVGLDGRSRQNSSKLAHQGHQLDRF